MSEADRIRWQCRRGLLELDLVLAAFLDRHFRALDAHDVALFRELLERPDNELLDLVIGRAEPAGRVPPHRVAPRPDAGLLAVMVGFDVIEEMLQYQGRSSPTSRSCRSNWVMTNSCMYSLNERSRFSSARTSTRWVTSWISIS